MRALRYGGRAARVIGRVGARLAAHATPIGWVQDAEDAYRLGAWLGTTAAEVYIEARRRRAKFFKTLDIFGDDEDEEDEEEKKRREERFEELENEFGIAHIVLLDTLLPEEFGPEVADTPATPTGEQPTTPATPSTPQPWRSGPARPRRTGANTMGLAFGEPPSKFRNSSGRRDKGGDDAPSSKHAEEAPKPKPRPRTGGGGSLVDKVKNVTKKMSGSTSSSTSKQATSNQDTGGQDDLGDLGWDDPEDPFDEDLEEGLPLPAGLTDPSELQPEDRQQPADLPVTVPLGSVTDPGDTPTDANSTPADKPSPEAPKPLTGGGDRPLSTATEDEEPGIIDSTLNAIGNWVLDTLGLNPDDDGDTGGSGGSDGGGGVAPSSGTHIPAWTEATEGVERVGDKIDE